MKTKVIYIIGSAHSGSTLLDLILGTHSRIAGVGEVNERVAQMLTGEVSTLSDFDQTCTCGRKLLDCPYWIPIADRIRRLGICERDFLLNPVFATRDNKIFVEEVLRQSAKTIYLESTKSIDRLTSLQREPDFDVYVLHLVRDGRAVVYSNMCKGRDIYSYAKRWGQKNLALLEQSRAFPKRWLTVRYELLATHPADQIRRVMDFIGEEFEPAQLDYSNSPHHNIDGNRMRFRGGSAIVADTRYLIDMRPYQWAMATAWAFRGLRRFDYPLSRRKMRAAIFS